MFEPVSVSPIGVPPTGVPSTGDFSASEFSIADPSDPELLASNSPSQDMTKAIKEVDFLSQESLNEASLRCGHRQEHVGDEMRFRLENTVANYVCEGRIFELISQIRLSNELLAYLTSPEVTQDVIDQAKLRLKVDRRTLHEYQLSSSSNQAIRDQAFFSRLRENLSVNQRISFMLSKRQLEAIGEIVLAVPSSFNDCDPNDLIHIAQKLSISEDALLKGLRENRYSGKLILGLEEASLAELATFVSGRPRLTEDQRVYKLVETRVINELLAHRNRDGGYDPRENQELILAEASRRNLAILVRSLALTSNDEASFSDLKAAGWIWFRDFYQEIRIFSNGDVALIEAFYDLGLFEQNYLYFDDPLNDVKSIFEGLLLRQDRRGRELAMKLQNSYQFTWEKFVHYGMDSTLSKSSDQMHRSELYWHWCQFGDTFNIPMRHRLTSRSWFSKLVQSLIPIPGL